MSVRNSSTLPKGVERVYVGEGLKGLDDDIDLLESYFREMQKTSVETAYGPEDFLSFAACAHYFGVIMIETLPAVPSESNVDEETLPVVPSESNMDDGTDEDAEGELEEETLPVSRATSPPSSIAHSPNPGSPHTTALSNQSGGHDSLVSALSMSPRTRSEQERDQKWEKYFQTDLQAMGEQLFLQPEEDPSAPFFPRREMPHLHSAYLISDRPHASSTSGAVDDCVNWSDSNGSTEPVIQQGSSKFYRAMNNPLRPSLAPLNVGQEYQSVQSDSQSFVRGETISPTDKADPNFESLLREAAIRLQGELRSNRVRAHESKTTPIESKTSSIKPKARPIGLIYLSTSQHFLDPLHMGECNMGLYIAPAFRQKEAIIDVVNDVTEIAFSNHECHRLQFIVVDHEDKLPILKVLAAVGFHKEGDHRRAFYSNAAGEWKNVAIFAMLATDWVYDNNGNESSHVRLRTKSLWDDLLSRHQRECDDLVRLEERHAKTLKRVASTETVRESLSEGDTAGYSQRALQKKRRLEIADQESREFIINNASSISDFLSCPGIALQENQAVVPIPSDMRHSPGPILPREPRFSISLRSRKSSDSQLSTVSDSSFSNISSTDDWEMLDDDDISTDSR